MSVMDRFITAMKINEQEDDDGFYDSDSEEEYNERPQTRRTSSAAEHKSSETDDSLMPENDGTAGGAVRKLAQKVTPIKQTPRRNSSGSADLLSIYPKTYEDSKIITDTLLENKAVILNLEGLEYELAQRIIDFSSGSCYALGGNLQWISKYIIIIAPQNINISGDFQNLPSTDDTPVVSPFGRDL